MTEYIELIKVIGLFIVTPICAFGALAVFIGCAFERDEG